jgi:hypothetical protein
MAGLYSLNARNFSQGKIKPAFYLVVIEIYGRYSASIQVFWLSFSWNNAPQNAMAKSAPIFDRIDFMGQFNLANMDAGVGDA